MYIPYGRQSIDEKDIEAVVKVLRSDFLTTGPTIAEFEKKVMDYTGAKYAIAAVNGTSALRTERQHYMLPVLQQELVKGMR